MQKTVLYIHGMGGGADSRIPAVLAPLLAPHGVRVVVRTYDFDPELGRAQIQAWERELCPALIVGESLGVFQALRAGAGLPHVFVSPSLGAAEKLYRARFLAWFALGRRILHRHFPVREGDRQALRFVPEVLCKYRAHRQAALDAIVPGGKYFAFFGTHDHYMRSGVVRVSLWKKHFGDAPYTLYDGTHFMEEEYVSSLLAPKVLELLG